LLVVAAGIGTYVWAVTPPYGEREYERGRIAYYAGDLATAEVHFHRAFRADMKNNRYRHARGYARLQLSKYSPLDEAQIEDILGDLKFTQSGGADPVSLAVHAYMNQRRGRTNTSIEMYSYILQRFDYRPIMALNNRAWCYMGKREWDKARIDLDQAVKLRPPHHAVYCNRAWMALAMRLEGKTKNIPEEALEDLEQAVRLAPKHWSLYRDAARLYSLAANDDSQHPYFENALSYLRQAILAGADPMSFRASPSLSEALKRPQFVELLRSPRPEASSQPGLGLIDPIEDLPDF
jgi:tetratricopeptide (TPR) repeat protein